MIITCPLHSGCEAWTGEERRAADGDYRWECATGLTWCADGTGAIEPDDEEDGCSVCGCTMHTCTADCDCCPEHRDDHGVRDVHRYRRL